MSGYPDWIDEATRRRIAERRREHLNELARLVERAEPIVTRVQRDLFELQQIQAQVHRLAGTIAAADRTLRALSGEGDGGD